MLYRVVWEIDIEAGDPEEAAREALKVQRDPESIATIFDVRRSDGKGLTARYDLWAGEPHGASNQRAKRCCKCTSLIKIPSLPEGEDEKCENCADPE